MEEEAVTSGRKDGWDKLSAVGPLLAGLIISGIGSWFTYSYNQRQISLQEVQTVERFMPHLLGDQEAQELAILAISSLGNTRLATDIAVRFPSTGTAAALESISATGDDDTQAIADSALLALEGRREQLISDMFASDRQTRIAATTELVRKWTTDLRIVAIAIEQAESNLDNGSGRINTLVLLENMSSEVLAEYADDIEDLLATFESTGGEQTLEHVSTVRARLESS
ncbi:MAG: hypothetical protein MJB57_12655 [Gemmatimonadetes bacterium]|nr:hypothetical protein [Gemmatimonadota bacterium]